MLVDTNDFFFIIIVLEKIIPLRKNRYFVNLYNSKQIFYISTLYIYLLFPYIYKIFSSSKLQKFSKSI